MQVPRFFVPALLALASASALASTASNEAPEFNPAGIMHKVGHYKCELNRSVQVRHVEEDLKTAVVNWNRRDYTMKAVNTASGALRYEDGSSGLVWIVITGKSMLLDTRQGKQLANECRA